MVSKDVTLMIMTRRETTIEGREDTMMIITMMNRTRTTIIREKTREKKTYKYNPRDLDQNKKRRENEEETVEVTAAEEETIETITEVEEEEETEEEEAEEEEGDKKEGDKNDSYKQRVQTPLD